MLDYRNIVEESLLHKYIERDLGANFKNDNYLFFYPLLSALYIFSNLLKLILRKNQPQKEVIALVFTGNQKNVFDLLNLEIDFIDYRFIKSTRLLRMIAGLEKRLIIDLFRLKKTEIFKQNWKRILKSILIISDLENRITVNSKIIIFNDHSIHNRMVIQRFKETSTLVYIQHAHVTERFPPLICQHNILFSKAAYDSYTLNRSTNLELKTHIVGDLRLTKFLNLPANSSKKTILICTNELDEINKVKKFGCELKKHGYTITLRKHPLDKRDWESELWVVSSNKLESDIEENHIILLNESGIFLEACISKRLVYKCYFSNFTDHYGFEKQGIILEKYYNPQKLIDSITNKKISYNADKLEYITGDIPNGIIKTRKILTKILRNEY